MRRHKLIKGIKLPDDSALTEDELDWVGFLRLLSPGPVPAPTLRAVQALRMALQETTREPDRPGSNRAHMRPTESADSGIMQ